MTFYSIIFGYLFIEACKQFLCAFNTGGADHFAAAAIAIMVFNDAVHTSDYFDDPQPDERSGKPPVYTLALKLIDLASFFLLGFALISLDLYHGTLATPGPEGRGRWMHECPGFIRLSVPWLLLSLYWVNASLWNVVDGMMERGWPSLLKGYSLAIMAPFILSAYAVEQWGPADSVTRSIQFIACIAPLPYFLYFKQRHRHQWAVLPGRTLKDPGAK